MTQKHKIFHMASFSRSGETLFLRCLNAHPKIHVVHQVREPDRPEDFKLFKFLSGFEPTEIPENHPLVRKAGVKAGKVLVLKNAVWSHKYPFSGFVLVRNSLSVFNSFKIAGEKEKAFAKRKLQYERWAKDMDPALLPAIQDADNAECLCMLYNRKMAPLAKAGLPIVRYEDFVRDPKKILSALLEKLGVPWDEAVLNSHEGYKEGEFGHGHIPLWKPIHTDSLDSYRKHSPGLLAKIYGLTYPTMEAFGYTLKNNELVLRNDVPGLVGGA